MISLIVAHDRNRAIGKNGDIPWRLPEDLKAFQQETTGGAVIMGRKTWDSLPVKPLKNRCNIVVTSNPDIPGLTAASVTDAIKTAQDLGYQRIYGIGGSRIYSEMMDLADQLIISYVDVEVDGADTFFPEFEEMDWQLTSICKLASEPNLLSCTIKKYERRKDTSA